MLVAAMDFLSRPSRGHHRRSGIMVSVSEGWKLDVERGPDWLFVRLHNPPAIGQEGEPLAEQLWSLLEQHFMYRLVLELDDVQALRSSLIGQLVLLYKRIHQRGGMLRICGLGEAQRQALRSTRLDERFPCYKDREDAVMGDSRIIRPR
jgi:anti-anti-sigma factor